MYNVCIFYSIKYLLQLLLFLIFSFHCLHVFLHCTRNVSLCDIQTSEKGKHSDDSQHLTLFSFVFRVSFMVFFLFCLTLKQIALDIFTEIYDRNDFSHRSLAKWHDQTFHFLKVTTKLNIAICSRMK